MVDLIRLLPPVLEVGLQIVAFVHKLSVGSKRNVAHRHEEFVALLVEPGTFRVLGKKLHVLVIRREFHPATARDQHVALTRPDPFDIDTAVEPR